MKELQQKYGMAILFITHDLAVISEIADEVIVMRKGTIIETGNPEKIFKNPGESYTRALLECRPDPDSKKKRLATVEEIESGESIDLKRFGTSSARAEHAQSILVDNLTVQFKTQSKGKKRTLTAVDHVSFEVEKGETVGLVGESGCGKTTLGRSILKLVEIKSGKILYEGVDIHSKRFQTKKYRKKVQIIFQDPYSTLNPRLIVGAAITEPMKVHGLGGSSKARKNKAIELLERVGLEASHYHRYPHEFSGGQRQRIGIARALAVEPEFIVCDESVSALDVSVQAQVLNLLNDLKEEFGFTFIFISHDLSVVRHMSDRILVMKEGKIVESGEAETLFKHPENEYTKQLLYAVPKIK
jgi:peptide/nickel transport system ATP-binding protein